MRAGNALKSSLYTETAETEQRVPRRCAESSALDCNMTYCGLLLGKIRADLCMTKWHMICLC